MIQPNVYWTLEAPFLTLVGLYTNVPDGGRLDEDQIAWLEQELAQAPPDRALILAMHHPIYSLDSHHSGSAYLSQVFDEVTSQAARLPDLVLAGHVHNYQRFTRTVDGRQTPYLVAGTGGYHNLHHLAPQTLKAMGTLPEVPGSPEVRFEAYADDRYGFLRLEVSASTVRGVYVGVEVSRGTPATAELDGFTLDLTTHTVTTAGAASAPPAHPARRRSTSR